MNGWLSMQNVLTYCLGFRAYGTNCRPGSGSGIEFNFRAGACRTHLCRWGLFFFDLYVSMANAIGPSTLGLLMRTRKKLQTL